MAPACQRARVQVDVVQHAITVKNTIRQAGRKHLNITELEITPSFITAVLPANNMNVIELPNERKEDFITHIKAVYNDVKQQSPNNNKTYISELETEDSAQTKALLGKACATCKGYCCGLGDTHAFQDYWSLELFLKDNKDWTVDDVVNRYTAYLPDKAYEAACVFQGTEGCTLPEEMRSITCRNYKCRGLSDYQLHISQGQDNLTVAGSVQNGNVLNISVFNDEEFSRLD